MNAGNAFWLMSSVMQSAAAAMGLAIAAYVFLWQLFDEERDPNVERATEMGPLNQRARSFLHRRFMGVLGLLVLSIILCAISMVLFPPQPEPLCAPQSLLMAFAVVAFAIAVL